jgi:uncharacterized protein (TIGR02145 family)
MEEGTFTDPRDGKVYRTVRIGNQVWMAENLNYDAEGSKCYNNDPANRQKYGWLYDWETAKAVCPDGWHLPSDAEWQELVDFAGGDRVAGRRLKARDGWDNGNGIDDLGFPFCRVVIVIAILAMYKLTKYEEISICQSTMKI